MVLIEAKKNKKIFKIGTSAGMVRASSGYSMRKIANWLSMHKGKTLKKIIYYLLNIFQIHCLIFLIKFSLESLKIIRIKVRFIY